MERYSRLYMACDALILVACLSAVAAFFAGLASSKVLFLIFSPFILLINIRFWSSWQGFGSSKYSYVIAVSSVFMLFMPAFLQLLMMAFVLVFYVYDIGSKFIKR